MDRILVTGSNGFIGHHLCKRLILDGYSVFGIDNLSVGTKDNAVRGASYFYTDVNNISLLDTKKINCVFHLAALSRIQPSFENPHDTYLANAASTEAVCEFVRKNRIGKLVYAGSSSRWQAEKSPYSVYKETGENICTMYRDIFNLNVEIVRFYNVYGDREITEGDWAALIGKWRKQIKSGEPLTIVGDGEQRRTFTHVEDIVAGLVKVMNNKIKNDEGWELGGNKDCSINQVFQMFKQRFGCDSLYVPQQKGNYPTSVRKNNKAEILLDWKPVHSLKDYIKNLQ